MVQQLHAGTISNCKVQLGLDLARFNNSLIRLVHRGSTLNNILLRLVGVKYLTLIDASLGYYALKPCEQSAYLTCFSCPFGRYRYIRLPFGVAPHSDMFQRKIDKLLNELPLISGVADDILIAGFELGRKYDETVDKVLKTLWKANLKLNKDKCCFRCTSILFSGEVTS